MFGEGYGSVVDVGPWDNGSGECEMSSRAGPRRVGLLIAAALAALVALWGAGGLQPAGAATAPTLIDRALAAGVYQINQTWSACETPGGMLYVGNHAKGSVLYSSNGAGLYTRITTNAWPTVSPKVAPDRHDCAWADVDHNGLLDMANSTGRNLSNFVKPAWRDGELWLQTSFGQFTDVGTNVGIADPCGRGRREAFFDVNKDGWADLFVGNEIGRPVTDPCDDPANGYPSENPKLYLNRGADAVTGKWLGFRLAQDFGVDDPGQHCAESIDANGDTWPDLLACRLGN
ncbi:MAG: hypothetical protein WAN48_08945, partial [Actinomycetes bacterium]